MYLPNAVRELMERLESQGFQCWAVGGCVRDSLLGIAPHDFDCCTSALPEQLQAVFADRQLVLAGVKHGTVGVVTGDGVVEITTFRTEGDYSDARHPGWVRFVPEIWEDLARRDFTINAMAWSPSRGLCDPFRGREDLHHGILRAVGDPDKRFQEDALRILRGLRFAARFDLTIEENTRSAMDRQIAGLDALARERVFAELTGFLPRAKARDLLNAANLICRVIPELGPSLGFDQKNPHHDADVFAHTAAVVERVPAEEPLRMAALLHDIGKPSTFSVDEQGIGHFFGHAQAGAQLADAVLRRLKAPTAFREEVVFLVAHHMDRYPLEEKAARRCLSRHGLNRMLKLLALQSADFGCEADDWPREFAQLLKSVAEREGALTLKTLAVKGRDLMELGVAPGPELGRMLEELLQKVLSGELPNERQALLDALNL